MKKIKWGQRSLLFYCALATVLLHVGALVYLFSHPLLLKPTFQALLSKATSLVSSDETPSPPQQKESLISDALNQMAYVAKESDVSETSFPQTPNPTVEESEASSFRFDFALPELQIETPRFTSVGSLTFPRLDAESLFAEGQPQIDPSALADLVRGTPLDLMLSSSPLVTTLSTQEIGAPLDETSQEEKSATASVQEESLPFAMLESQSLVAKIPVDMDPLPLIPKQESDGSKETFILPKSSLQLENAFTYLNNKSARVGSIDFYNLSDVSLVFSDWSDFFSVEAVLLPAQNSEGYRFAVTLVPKDDLGSIQMKQNFYFFIDRSNSIERHRFAGFKRAVLRALSTLNEGNSFNICIFDKRKVWMAKENLPFTSRNFQLAEDFLSKQEYAGHFSAAEIYSSLDKLMPQETEDDAMNVGILLSDGSTLLSTRKQKEAINQWLDNNRSKLTLYAAAVGNENNLTLLNVLTSQGGGEVLHSSTHAAFPRKLAKFVRNLREPLAKKLTVNVFPNDPNTTLSLKTPRFNLPALYNNRPFTVLGTVSSPGALTLSIRAIHNNQPILIEKIIEFDSAPTTNSAIEKQWAQLQASEHYSHFLITGNSDDLKKAEALLTEEARPRRRTRQRLTR